MIPAGAAHPRRHVSGMRRIPQASPSLGDPQHERTRDQAVHVRVL
jgi:hypothetical protein